MRQRRPAESLIVLMAASTGFYAAKLTAFSPVYLIYGIVLALLLPLLLKRVTEPIAPDAAVLAVLLLYTCATQLSSTQTGAFVNLTLGASAYVTIRGLRATSNPHYLRSALDWMFLATGALLLADTVYRLSHPGYPVEAMADFIQDDSDFYKYKYNTLMFADSNTTGLIALILYFVADTVIKRFTWIRMRPWTKPLFGALIILSLSRAAVIAWIVTIMVRHVGHKPVRYRIVAILAIASMCAVALPIAYEAANQDASFGTKLELLSSVLLRVEASPASELMFGHGLDSSVADLGRATHVLLLTYLYEMGVLGVILLAIFTWRYASRYGAEVITPVFLASLSYFLYAGAPFLFVPLALLANCKDFDKRSIRHP